MNTFYLSSTTFTSKVYFETDPIPSVAPNIEKTILEFNSAPSWSGANIVSPKKSFLDLGAYTYGTPIILTGNYMTLARYESFAAKFTVSPPAQQYYYDAIRDITYNVILKSFVKEYVTGTQVLNWKMEMINLGVVANEGD